MDTTNTRFWDELAVKSYRSLLKHKPDTPMIHNNLGLAYVRLGKTKQAVRSFQKAIRLDRSYADPHYHLATVYHQTGNARGATKHFKEFQTLSGGSQEVVDQLLESLKRPSSLL